MTRMRRFRPLALVLGLLTVGILAASPAGAASGAVLVADGLSSPKGLTLDRDGDPVVGQGALGPPGPILRFEDGVAEELTPVLSTTSVAYARHSKSFWVLGGDGKLYRQKHNHEGEAPVFVVDLYAYAAANPDPYNAPGEPAEESNPFGLTALPNGNALVTDAAANSLLRITPSGKITTVARFPKETISTDHIPGGGLPPTIDAESVPTSVVSDRRGNTYVGELKGFPFRPGSSNIWKIEPNASGAICSADPAIPSRRCELAVDGQTSIAALALASNGHMFVYSYAAGGVGVFEAQCETPAGCPPAVLTELDDDGDLVGELAAGELSEPGEVEVDGDDIWVTDGLFSGGRLLHIDWDD